MKPKRLFSEIFKTYFLIAAISILIISIYTANSINSFFYNQTANDLKARAQIISEQLTNLPEPLNTKTIDNICKSLGTATDMRVTITTPKGKVIGDSEKLPDKMDNHLNRPEIKGALTNGYGKIRRFSKTLKYDLVYVAIPIKKYDKTIAIVRTSLPIKHIDEIIIPVTSNIIIFGILVILIIGGVSLYFSKHITKPFETLEQGAKEFADGNLENQVQSFKILELDRISQALNKMAYQLNSRIETITTHNYEQEAIFSSMKEGIIALDDDHKIINMNKAAAELFNIDQNNSINLHFKEVIKNKKLRKLVKKALKRKTTLESGILINKPEERYIQAKVTVLKETSDSNLNKIIVLNDITNLRRLEKIRREFVANVSHELKTPVTTIKGFVETLTDGAIENIEESKQFLNIITRHILRLENIIEDLLTLSRIETESEKQTLSMKEESIAQLLSTVIDDCHIKANTKSILIDCDCNQDIRANVNFSLLIQAVNNLVDNAIKYSNKSSTITIKAEQVNTSTNISVIDQGCGIPQKHIERLFERFYRVDKARSRKLGGTGLGLAIVKHIVQAHNGYITVESETGTGSNFTIHLPNSIIN